MAPEVEIAKFSKYPIKSLRKICILQIICISLQNIRKHTAIFVKVQTIGQRFKSFHTAVVVDVAQNGLEQLHKKTMVSDFYRGVAQWSKALGLGPRIIAGSNPVAPTRR